MKTQILTDIFGALTLVNYIVGYFFVLIALILRWTYVTHKAVKNNHETPSKFSWSYWFENNLVVKVKNLVQIIIIVFLIFRFTSDFTGEVFSYILAVSIGLAYDAYKKKVSLFITNLKKKLLG